MNFDLFGIIGVGSVAVICYIIGMIAKASPINDKWIPVICGVSGAVLGLVAYFISIPEFAGVDLYMAVAKGGVSGLAAVGANQIYKQLKGNKDE